MIHTEEHEETNFESLVEENMRTLFSSIGDDSRFKGFNARLKAVFEVPGLVCRTFLECNYSFTTFVFPDTKTMSGGASGFPECRGRT